jgi:hypothetical protein
MFIESADGVILCMGGDRVNADNVMTFLLFYITFLLLWFF